MAPVRQDSWRSAGLRRRPSDYRSRATTPRRCWQNLRRRGSPHPRPVPLQSLLHRRTDQAVLATEFTCGDSVFSRLSSAGLRSGRSAARMDPRQGNGGAISERSWNQVAPVQVLSGARPGPEPMTSCRPVAGARSGHRADRAGRREADGPSLSGRDICQEPPTQARADTASCRATATPISSSCRT